MFYSEFTFDWLWEKEAMLMLKVGSFYSVI